MVIWRMMYYEILSKAEFDIKLNSLIYHINLRVLFAKICCNASQFWNILVIITMKIYCWILSLSEYVVGLDLPPGDNNFIKKKFLIIEILSGV